MTPIVETGHTTPYYDVGTYLRNIVVYPEFRKNDFCLEKDSVPAD